MIGIYSIKNLINNKIYIGSSINITKRINQHFNNLKNNKHNNKHLQFSYNKYGIKNFSYEILEIFDNIDRNELFKIEADYLEKYNIEELYNLTMFTNCGGAETLCKKSCLLDLKGNLIKEFNSLLSIAKFLNVKQIPTNSINNSSTIKSTYRIVTKEFYEKELELILSWRNYKSIKDKFNAHYKYDLIKNKWIIFNNDIIIAIVDDEQQAIRISKHLVDLIQKKLI